MIYFQYLLCVAVIVAAGVKLAKYGDVIGSHLGLGRTFVGLVMLATVTSLPELSIGISSVALHNLPEIAVGDIVGSCLFNLAIFAFLDFFCKGEPLTAKLNKDHALTASWGIILIGVFCLFLAAGQSFAIAGVGIGSFVLIAVYALGMWIIYKRREPQLLGDSDKPEEHYMSLRRASIYYVIAGAIVVIAGSWMPAIASEIAARTGITQGFVGTTFVAISTSLPELAITLGAIQMQAFNMAAGNLLGSNLFNMLILAIDDVAYRKGSLIGDISSTHLIAAIGSIIMTSIIVAAISVGGRKKHLPIAADALAMLVVFGASLYFSYALGDAATIAAKPHF